MSKPVYVIGHRNPDTDSICSAIAYAYMKRVMGINAIPARAGKINAETKFVLDYFNIESPLLISDMYPRARDILVEPKSVAHPHDTMRDIGQMMFNTGVKSIPVVDEDNKLVGMISVGDLAKRYYEELEMQDLSEAGVDYECVLKALDGQLICGTVTGRKVSGKVKIAAARSVTMVKMIEPEDIVLVGDRGKAQLACMTRNIACLIVTGSGPISKSVKETAEKYGVILISTPYDTYTCARLINQSIPASVVMQTEVIAFKPTDMVSDLKNIIVKTKYRTYPIIEKGKLIGIVSRDGLIVPEKEQVILIDHNEHSQAVEGIEEARILEIIDHHRLGGLETGEPIYIRHEPVGCTATIIANMMWHRNIEMTREIAGLLLSAIISDTMLFKSPTCTEIDKENAYRLADIAGVNVHDFGMQLLKAGSKISTMSPLEIVKNDLKEFHLGDYKFAIGQISVLDPDEVITISADIKAAMENMLFKENYDMVLLMVTDILKEGSYIIYIGKLTTLIEHAFGKEGKNNMLYLPGVMSRKKQIVPPLIEAAK